MRARTRRLVLLTSVVLIALSAWIDTSLPERRSSSVALRLFGPLSQFAARAQWVRVRAAMLAGRTDLALARGQLALDLDPGDTQGWTILGLYLSQERASIQRERDPERRLAWLRAGLELLQRGEASAREPQELALWQGLVLSQFAHEDEPVPWPGGTSGLWEAAAGAFDRAALLGHPDGEPLAESARARVPNLGIPAPHR